MSRTLVKSPPELWAECSEAASLSRHLSAAFGEIRITRLEPETAVAWEGEDVSGTVRIEPSGWGTRVTLTAAEHVRAAEPEIATEEVAAAAPAQDEGPPAGPPPAPGPRPRGALMARIRAFFRPARPEAAVPSPQAPAPLPEPAAPTPDPEPEPSAPERLAPETPPEATDSPSVGAGAALAAALDSLGQAHHRPFSRA